MTILLSGANTEDNQVLRYVHPDGGNLHCVRSGGDFDAHYARKKSAIDASVVDHLLTVEDTVSLLVLIGG